MCRYIVILLLFFPLASFSQVQLSFQKADSLSYQYYLKGDWRKLIDITKNAFNHDIESKFLRQRAGYAYFMSGDYYAAKTQYEKALSFDQSDNVTREYLYYSCLNAGYMNTRYYAGNLEYDSANKLGIHKYNPVEYVDTEINLKTNQESTRSNQVYYRAGINTELGYRVSLYQACSFYEQYIGNVLTQQPEYLAILKITIAPAWQVKTAYHRLFTSVGNTNYPENLGFIALSSQLNRFNLEANASVLQSVLTTTQQYGFQARYVLPGRPNIYFTSAVAGMIENSASRTIFSESAGLKCISNLWAEGNITLGNLKNYSTCNSLYVNNSTDPSVFRTGLTLAWFLGKHLELSGNFTFDQQEIVNFTTNKYYYQYSYSGGIKWKL
jgi:hypothetical protein